MKKLFIILLISFFSINLSFANKSINLGKQIPNKFKLNCYEFVGEKNLEKIYKENNLLGYQTFKINTDKKIDTFLDVNGKQIIPHKLFKKAGENIDLNILNLDGNKSYLSDNNAKTFLELDTTKNKQINISLNNGKNTSLIFNFISDNYFPEYFVSEDGEKYFKVEKKNIGDYNIKNIRIKFESYKTKEVFEKIKISELSLFSKNYVYLVKSLIGGFTAYSKNICSNNYPNLSNNIGEYNLDKNTKIIDLELKINPKSNPNKKEDKDNDGITDNLDNCPKIYNPKQLDKTGNGKGDLCSDDDSDGIIGEKDNCIYISNPEQKDINRNNVGDKCEFDKDEDGIFDKLDNCINTPNPDQKDDDNDGILDACDNCKLYNPRQIDKNNSGVGDVCESADKYLKDNDKDLDKILDSQDNCKGIYNPKQSDIDEDGIGDFCDNCKNYQNSDQLDLNKNGVGDICEDSDGDGIEGLKDNCINIANPDQKDSDNNGIGDACEDSDGDKILFKNDNCPYIYNPNQSDIDSDGIGDKCDKSDDRFIESNNTIFIVLLLLIVALFGFAIFKMVKKLK